MYKSRHSRNKPKLTPGYVHIILIRNIQVRVTCQAFEVSVMKRHAFHVQLTRLHNRLILKQSLDQLVVLSFYVCEKKVAIHFTVHLSDLNATFLLAA